MAAQIEPQLSQALGYSNQNSLGSVNTSFNQTIVHQPTRSRLCRPIVKYYTPRILAPADDPRSSSSDKAVLSSHTKLLEGPATISPVLPSKATVDTRDSSIVPEKKPRLQNPFPSMKGSVLPCFLWATQKTVVTAQNGAQNDMDSLPDQMSKQDNNVVPRLTLSTVEHHAADEMALRYMLIDVHETIHHRTGLAWLQSDSLGLIPSSGTVVEGKVFANAQRKSLSDTFFGLKESERYNSLEGYTDKKKLLIEATELIGFFVPASYKCDVVDKFWGAIDTLFHVISAPYLIK